MIILKKTNAANSDFLSLVKQLDDYLVITDGDDHAFYDQFNKLSAISHVIVAYINNIPVGCGAIKEFDKSKVEIKRMYTNPLYRGKGIASEILNDLELWAEGLGYQSCILETGIRQVEAISLYIKQGYIETPNYGQYKNIKESICFSKTFNK
jgi:GNAT superfamily N-acetyltransferase